MKLSREHIKEFWAAGLKRFDAKDADKRNSSFMKSVGDLLDGIGVMDQGVFLAGYTTTIGDTIYRPFTVGVNPGAGEVDDQPAILVHELTHVEQWRADRAGFYGSYLVAGSRALHEAEAIVAETEFSSVLFGQKPTMDSMRARIGQMRGYALGDEHIESMLQFVEARIDILQSGAVASPVADWALSWFETAGYALPVTKRNC